MTRRAAILVSGTGRHLEHIGRLCQAGELDLEVGLCLSNKPGVLALERPVSCACSSCRELGTGAS